MTVDAENYRDRYHEEYLAHLATKYSEDTVNAARETMEQYGLLTPRETPSSTPRSPVFPIQKSQLPPTPHSRAIRFAFHRQFRAQSWEKFGLFHPFWKRLKASKMATQNGASALQNIVQLASFLASLCLLRICARLRQLLRVFAFLLAKMWLATGASPEVRAAADKEIEDPMWKSMLQAQAKSCPIDGTK